ncbi:MAG: ASCH domain-containing protein [Candidatus Aenigmatarchaeota archaeon]|nr:MAG: ASCH domain-containing protein [Candidatus Aenigmarchaeota archaeon]
MKCLSVKQPYADLILSGRKTIENRHWNAAYRGDLLIHASANVDAEGCKRLGIDPAKLAKGAILGKVRMVDVIKYDSLDKFRFLYTKHFAPDAYYDEGKTFGLVMTQPQRFPKPVLLKGRLGMFEVRLTRTGRIETNAKRQK